MHSWVLRLVVWVLLRSSALGSPLTSADVEELESINSWVIVRSSPCSATCGLGLRTQELCPHGGTAAVGRECHVRQVRCRDTWQCGLQMVTAAAGGRVELDCLGEVMAAAGRFAFAVSWRFARGVVTTDDTLFARWDAPGLDRVVLDPLLEEDAGTYRCDVQDADRRRVKRVYKGVKVLPAGVLSLDFARALSQWEQPGGPGSNNTLASGLLYPSSTLRDVLLCSLSISAAVAMFIVLALYWVFYWKRSTGMNPTPHGRFRILWPH